MTVYQHFRKHEHPFVDQVLSWVNQVEHRYSMHITDFLDPRQQKIIESLIGTTNEETTFHFFGGNEHVERKRAIIAPFFMDIRTEDFELAILEAHFSNKFTRLTHRDVLGSLLSLGIDRKKIGDIIVLEDRFQIVTTIPLATYVKMNLSKVNNMHIDLSERSFNDLEEKQEKWLPSHYTVSSLRLDIFIKEVYRMSRKNAVNFITSDRVKVNHTDVNDPSVQLMEKDLVSVRGHGRSKVMEILGKTKKDKIRMMAAKLST